jgi:hypothetical protein
MFGAGSPLKKPIENITTTIAITISPISAPIFTRGSSKGDSPADFAFLPFAEELEAALAEGFAGFGLPPEFLSGGVPPPGVVRLIITGTVNLLGLTAGAVLAPKSWLRRLD